VAWVTVELDRPDAAYLPRERVQGRVRWHLESSRGPVEVRLFWYTESPEDRDVGVADTLRVEAPDSEGEASFGLALPAAPYSFTGSLFAVRWAVEAVDTEGGASARADLVVSPTGRVVVLPE
jgi:hypothetical protein